MTQLVTSIDIAAAPARVWDVLVDIEQWPEWTASMKKVARMDDLPFSVGSRAQLWIRGGMGPTAWTVTKLEPMRSFSWQARVMPGLTMAADHELAPSGEHTHVVLRITMSGPLAGVAAPLMTGVSRRNMKTEAEGLKARSEQG